MARCLVLNRDRDQNYQGRKLDFINQRAGDEVYNSLDSPYQVVAGTAIAASLVTGINSDLSGLVIAQITKEDYDPGYGPISAIPAGRASYRQV